MATADSFCFPCTIRELDTAIPAMQSKGATGPGDINPTFLKALGPMAKAELIVTQSDGIVKQ